MNIFYFTENIKLSMVTFKDWDAIFEKQGEFLIPDEVVSTTPLPEWFDPDNLVIKFEPWKKCPSDDRKDIFALFKGRECKADYYLLIYFHRHSSHSY